MLSPTTAAPLEAPMLLRLTDPYGLGRDVTHHVDVTRLAALAECRATHPGRTRWRFGEPVGCADHAADARLAAARLDLTELDPGVLICRR